MNLLSAFRVCECWTNHQVTSGLQNFSLYSALQWPYLCGFFAILGRIAAHFQALLPAAPFCGGWTGHNHLPQRQSNKSKKILFSTLLISRNSSYACVLMDFDDKALVLSYREDKRVPIGQQMLLMGFLGWRWCVWEGFHAKLYFMPYMSILRSNLRRKLFIRQPQTKEM